MEKAMGARRQAFLWRAYGDYWYAYKKMLNTFGYQVKVIWQQQDPKYHLDGHNKETTASFGEDAES